MLNAGRGITLRLTLTAVNARSLAATDNHTTQNLQRGTCEGGLRNRAIQVDQHISLFCTSSSRTC
jgi:hypothetical protein